ncbi:MAG TPA: endonuclease/exonuclease/phosphatase family protein [Flavobacteriaceae bacterium]|nr:endonuclease/exonuclease/phosphatase family protein [Flavobacteriaceae bacterium]
MRKLGLIGKFIYFINAIFALLLLLSLLVPYVPPKQFPIVSVLSLLVAPLILINIIFVGYWLLRLRKQLLLSTITLALCFVQFNSFYRIPLLTAESQPKTNQLRLMSYNVRSFNSNKWIDDNTVALQIESLIANENPDVVSFQEYDKRHGVKFSDFPYKYVKLKRANGAFGQAIYSKYPIVKQGSFDFENTSNNAIFVDIVKANDTLRIYNLHLESLHLKSDDLDFNHESSKKLVRRIANSFQIQQTQLEKVVIHKHQSPHKTIVTADMNNTAFSYNYRKLNTGMNDAFAKSGSGLGTTFVLQNIPLRIDFILADQRFDINKFTTFSEDLSDHFPISALLSWD